MKDIYFDVFNRSNKKAWDELTIFTTAIHDGDVKQLFLWGCKLCTERWGKSEYAIFNVSLEDGDHTFCTQHGFLTDNETFERTKPKIGYYKRMIKVRARHGQAPAREF